MDPKRIRGEDRQFMKEGFSIPEIKNNQEESFEPQISSQHLDQSNNKLALNIDIHDIISCDPQQQSRNPWTKGGLIILFYIKKFIKQIKNSSTLINYKFLTKEMVQLINDKASDNSMLRTISKQNRWLKTLRIIVNQIPIIEPESLFKIFWDTFVLIQIVINIFYIPMKLGFGLSNDSQLSTIFLESIPSWTFFTDIFLNFTTAQYMNGQIHRDKYGIFWNYIQSSFLLDLIIVVPFFLSSFGVPFTEYILLFRVARVKSMISNLEEIINPSQSIQAIISLVKSVFFILFVTHFCACLWTLLGELQQQSGASSWLEVKQIQDADWTSKYINSLYFSTITTLTVGYGDIVPTTDVERVFGILMALVICGVLGYTISSIGEILKQLNLNGQKQKQQMMILNNYLKKKKLSKQLQMQVRKYFEYFFKMQQNQDEDAEQMLQKLPKELKEQVAIDMYYTMLLKSRLIKNTLSKASVLKLCRYVSERKYVPDVLIAKQYSHAQFLYFVQSGEIQLTCKQNLQETILKTIGSQNFIGEREFIIQSQYDYSIKTSKFTQLAFINYEDFLKVVREDVVVDEKFCMMRDSLKFNVEKQNYGQICPICNWTHQYSECPMVFLKVNKKKIIKVFLTNVSQHRRIIIRRQRTQRKITLQQIQNDVIEFIVINEFMSIKELEFNALEKFGFSIDNKTIQSLKSQMNSGEKNQSQNSSKLQQPRKRISKTISRIVRKPDSMFQIMEVLDSQNMRMQNSFYQKISNKTNQSLNSLLTIHQNLDTPILERKSIISEQESMKKSIDISPMLQQVQEESTSPLNIINNIAVEYINFDLDKQFLTRYYFVNSNYDVVITQLQGQILQQESHFDISRLRRKKKKK